MKITQVAGIALTGFLFIGSAKADVLFTNLPGPVGTGTFWCDPCSSGNTGYRVWDSFTLSSTSTLQALNWYGSRNDDLSQGVQVEINTSPYGNPNWISPSPVAVPPPGVTTPDLFSATYADGDVSRVLSGLNSSYRTVSLPDVVLGPGTYWISVHGTSTTAQHTWLGVVEPTGDNSLIQYGPDPSNPSVIIPRANDAVFSLEGVTAAVPETSTWAMMILGFLGIGLLCHRRKWRMV